MSESYDIILLVSEVIVISCCQHRAQIVRDFVWTSKPTVQSVVAKSFIMLISSCKSFSVYDP